MKFASSFAVVFPEETFASKEQYVRNNPSSDPPVALVVRISTISSKDVMLMS